MDQILHAFDDYFLQTVQIQLKGYLMNARDIYWWTCSILYFWYMHSVCGSVKNYGSDLLRGVVWLIAVLLTHVWSKNLSCYTSLAFSRILQFSKYVPRLFLDWKIYETDTFLIIPYLDFKSVSLQEHGKIKA